MTYELSYKGEEIEKALERALYNYILYELDLASNGGKVLDTDYNHSKNEHDETVLSEDDLGSNGGNIAEVDSVVSLDEDNSFTGVQEFSVLDFNKEYDNGTVSSDITIDWNNGNNQVVTLAADIIIKSGVVTGLCICGLIV